MKKIGKVVLLLSVLFIITACKGSKELQGTWFATNSDNRHIKINITEKTITFDSENQNTWENKYKQTGIGFKNNISYKQIEFDDTQYTFVFPDKKNKENAIILIPYDSDDPTEGTIFWVLSKKDYPDYEKYK